MKDILKLAILSGGKLDPMILLLSGDIKLEDEYAKLLLTQKLLEKVKGMSQSDKDRILRVLLADKMSSDKGLESLMKLMVMGGLGTEEVGEAARETIWRYAEKPPLELPKVEIAEVPELLPEEVEIKEKPPPKPVPVEYEIEIGG